MAASFVHLHRSDKADDAFQTSGTLTIYDERHRQVFTCVTLEPQWNGNAFRNSCLPTGRYRLKRHKSPGFGDCLLVLDTAPRSAILIHAGNYRRDTVGCILPGSRFQQIDRDGHLDVAESKATLARLLAAFGTGTCDLLITADARWAT